MDTQSRNSSDILRRVFRYGIAGVINNLWSYLIYLLITWVWLEPKVAVTLMYPISAITGYFVHAKYSFESDAVNRYVFIRYGVAHLVGYFANIILLFILSDLLGYPHQLVQAVAIVLIAGILFILFRYYVFSQHTLTRKQFF